MRDTRFSKLCNVWNEIGPFDMSLFTHRIILQKKIFLLQEMGEDFGYTFSKYLRGPYCSALATDGYKVNMAEEIEKKSEKKMDENGLKLIEKLGKGHEEDPYWFELLASIVYFSKEDSDKESIKKKILDEKPYLIEEEDFDEAYNVLKKNNLI